jgi:hypothetical protein
MILSPVWKQKLILSGFSYSFCNVIITFLFLQNTIAVLKFWVHFDKVLGVIFSQRSTNVLGFSVLLGVIFSQRSTNVLGFSVLLGVTFSQLSTNVLGFSVLLGVTFSQLSTNVLGFSVLFCCDFCFCFLYLVHIVIWIALQYS